MNPPMLFLVLLFLVLSCKSEYSDLILTEKDLIPEGVAYNTLTDEIYLGSTYKQKILSIDKDKKIKTIFNQSNFNTLSPIGMEVDNLNQILWVCAAETPIVNESNTQKWNTAILSFDLSNKKLLAEFKLEEDQKQRFFNDITISDQGRVFITESVESKIYTINDGFQIVLFVDLEPYSFANGIAYYAPQNTLFIATEQGLVRLDVESKDHFLMENKTTINAFSIDGLAIFEDFFIAHQSTRVTKFYFNEKLTSLIRAEILDSGKEYDSSTTGEIGDGFYHYIVNSQIRSGIDQSLKSIKPMDSLENVIIRSIKLK